jgi:hypothetical protein
LEDDLGLANQAELVPGSALDGRRVLFDAANLGAQSLDLTS